MNDTFSSSEIVELGIEIEKNGRDFYSVLMAKSKDEGARQVFAYLVKAEEKHIKAFQKLLEKADANKSQEMVSDEYYAYMRALAGGYVFTQANKGKLLAEKIKSDREAIEQAVGFEKESIIFYEGMKESVPAAERSVIDELISQEHKHLRKLLLLKPVK